MNNTSSSEVLLQGGDEMEGGSNYIPNWVESFLGKMFFEKCEKHNMQKNELNRYCVNCDAAICRYCIITGRHYDHKILTIYRHVYQNVVPLVEMENHIHCDKIQPYKCNKKWVVSLTPLPHNGSGLLIEGDGACHICKRKLTDPERFRYCSIACKVQASTGKSMVHLFHSALQQKEHVEVDIENKRKRNRKGVPHRAPSN